MILFIIVVIVAIALFSVLSENKKNNEWEQHQREQWAKESVILQRKIDEWGSMRNSLIEKYGDPIKEIEVTKLITHSMTQSSILAFNNDIIWIDGEIYKFNDIISCSLLDNKKVINNYTQNSVTKTDTGSMLGRAVVGGLLTGGVGAVIGAATAKKETVTTNPHSEQTITHDYSIDININSISKPLVNIHVGSNQNITNEVIALLNMIISRNN